MACSGDSRIGKRHEYEDFAGEFPPQRAVLTTSFTKRPDLPTSRACFNPLPPSTEMRAVRDALSSRLVS
jgi:hypothetical protein